MKAITKKTLTDRMYFLASKPGPLSIAERNDLDKVRTTLEKVSKRKEDREKRIVNKAIDEVIKALGSKPSYHRKALLCEEIGQRLAPALQRDIQDHPLFLYAADYYVQYTVCPDLMSMLNMIWEKQTDTEDTYCDADIRFTKLVDTKDQRVTLIGDSSVCSDVNQFIIMEKKNGYGFEQRVHIRVVYKNKKRNKDIYQTRTPNLKFYKDLNYYIEYPHYDDSHVVMFHADPKETHYRPQHCLHYLPKLQQVYALLDVVQSCIEEDEVRDRNLSNK